MALDLSPYSVFNVVSGLLLVGLGAFVASARPRRRANLYLAAFSACFGAGWVVLYGRRILGVTPTSPPGGMLFAVFVVIEFLATLFLVAMALTLPRPVERADRRILLPALVAFAANVVVNLVAFKDAANGNDQVFAISQGLLEAGFLFALVVGALRYRASDAVVSRRDQQQLTLMSASLLLYPGYFTGVLLLEGAASSTLAGIIELAILILVAGLWLHSASRSTGAAARECRNIALLALAVPVLTMCSVLVVGLGDTGRGFPPGTARMLAVLILAYAILRHQLLDIDVKLKWTIKRGTLAGMFLAVFFVASQVAQNYFSQSYGVLAGGAAAGLLLFAIAPLQRVAERVADAAMPGVGQPTHAGTLAAAGVVPADPGTLVRKEDAYRGALRVALADRRMSPEEEIALARVAEELGLGAARAVELRIQVERETIRTTRGSRLRR